MMFLTWIALIAVAYFIISKAAVPSSGGGCCGHSHHEDKQTDTPGKQA